MAEADKAGGTAVPIDDPSTAELTGLNVLWAHNPDNFQYGFGYLSRLADIDAAVQNGMVLVLHDRLVGGASGILPGGSAFSITRDFTEGTDVNIRDENWDSTALTWAVIGSVEKRRLNPAADWLGVVQALLDAGASTEGVELPEGDADHRPDAGIAGLLRRHGVPG